MTCLTIDDIGSGSSTAIAEYDLAQLGIIVKEAAGPDALDNPEGPEPLMDVGKCQNSCWRPGPLPLSLVAIPNCFGEEGRGTRCLLCMLLALWVF
jgi:hypothetical protein